MSIVERGAALNSLRAAAAVATAPQLGRLSGQALQYYRYLTTAWLDQAFLELAYAVDADTFFECGAHEAAASVAFVQQQGKSAVAVEANPSTYENITRNAEQSGVVVLNCGLGESPGEATFYVPRNLEMAPNASFLQRPGKDYKEVAIRVTTIDALADQYLGEASRLALWIDVEGLAREVLRGGISTLRDPRCRILKVEVESERFWTDQSLAGEIDAILVDCGFMPVLRDIEFPNQYNLVYVRAELAIGLDELLLCKWAELANIKPVRVPLGIRTVVHAVRTRVMSEESGPLIFHRAAAALGSVSSAKVIAMRNAGRSGEGSNRGT